MKTKRFLSVLLATVMLFSLLSGTTLTAGAEVSVAAPTDTWHVYTADRFERGDGTAENPYVIKTAGQLAKLSKDVMEGNSYKNTYFVLEDNIDLEGHRWIPIGIHKWTPDETVNKPFSGSFDGKEKTVSNMYIDSALDGDYYSGLFGSISNYGATNSPVIKNLVVDDATVNYNAQNQENCISAIFAGKIGGNEAPRVQFSNITVSDSILINTATSNYYDLQSGAFAGYLDYALVQNCHTQNITVIGGANSGGFAGLTSSSAEFENCSATGSVSGDWAIGGFAGYALNSVSFTECTADVDVTANNWNAGGFCGYATYGTEFNKCVAYGDIKSTVTAFEPRLGGFAGMLAKTYFDDFAAASSMTNCYFAGELISAHETIKPSGLVALVEESTITDCAYDGELNTDIMGYNDETTSTALATKNLKAEICENVFDGHDIENNVCSKCGYEAYNIYVSGIQVTNVNAADVLGDGTVSYNAETNTLTLTDATINNANGDGIKVTGSAITIVGEDTVADGSNTISGSNAAVLVTAGNITFRGVFGDITGGAHGAVNSEISTAYPGVGGNIHIERGTILGNVSSEWYTFNADKGDIIIDGEIGNVSGASGFVAEIDGDIIINGKIGNVTGSSEYGMSAYKTIAVAKDAEVGNVTSSGLAGLISFESDVIISGKTGNISSPTYGAFAMGGNLTIDGQVSGVSGQCAIRANGDITISGDTGNIAGNGGVSGAGSSYGIRTDGGKIIISSIIGPVSASSSDTTKNIMAMVAKGGIELADSIVIKTPVNSKIDLFNTSNYTVYDNDSDTVASLVDFMKQYTVTYEANGGTVTPASATTGADGKLTELPTPTRTGYKFNGWFDAQTDGTEVTTDKEYTANTTIYAQWTKKSSGGGGGGSSSNTTTTTTKNDDGSTTKTTTNKITGTTTETTTYSDGSTTKVETQKDGTVTTTEKDSEGNKTVTTEKADGTTTTEETKKDGTIVKTETTASGETTAEVEAKGETEVVIPVENTDEVTKVIVTDKDGNETEAHFEVKDGGIVISVSGNSTVSVQTGHNCYAKDFTDVDLDSWYHLNIDYVLENGLMKGTSADKFAPNDNLTRAMLLTVLYRAEGEPRVSGITSFADLEKGQYYLDAVCWAQVNGIVNGVSETEFAPNDNITREQIAAIMHRYAQYKGYDVSVGENTNILSYDDFDSISEYAIASMQHAVGSGLMKGKTVSTLNPLDNATRAEIAAILNRVAVKIAVK